MAKKKNRNYYKSGKFNTVQWEARVVNDKTKQLATLDFTKNFSQAAQDLKNMKTKLNKEMNNITKQMNKIKKDSKTGDLLKSSLVNQINAYETARKEFLKEYKDLYNGAIKKYNEVLQEAYDALRASAITNQGAATTAQSSNISEGDDADIN